MRRDLLEPSETETASPYMGSAVWFSARVGGRLHADIAWTYRFPIAQMPRIAGLLAFRDESCASSDEDARGAGHADRPRALVVTAS